VREEAGSSFEVCYDCQQELVFCNNEGRDCINDFDISFGDNYSDEECEEYYDMMDCGEETGLEFCF